MKKIILIIALLLASAGAIHALGTLPEVYMNPVTGNDNYAGTPSVYPVRTWDRALSLAADGATIYVNGGPVAVTSDMQIDGTQYGAAHVTVTPHTGYTGALFAIAADASGTFSNITLKGISTAQVLLSVNSDGTLVFGANVRVTDNGQITVSNQAIILNATPPSDANYLLKTTYTPELDGRPIVEANGVTDPLQYFTLVEPVSQDVNFDYALLLDGTTIGLYERPKAGIYIHPISGNDDYSGAKPEYPVKTLARAVAIWNSRKDDVPGIAVRIMSSITLTENTTLGGGIKFVRHTGASGYMFIYTGMELIINDATIENGTVSAIMLYSSSSGTLTLNSGANLISSGSASIIYTALGTTTINPGATITSNYTGSYVCIQNTSGDLIMNGGTIKHEGSDRCINNTHSNSDPVPTFVMHGGEITTKGATALYFQYGPITINGGTITNNRTPSGNTIYNNAGSLTINGGTVNGGLTTSIYNYSSTSATATINGGTITSNTSAANGVIYSPSTLRVSGNAKISGTIWLANSALDQYCMYLTSAPDQGNTYHLKVNSDCTYAAAVKSDPAIDLGAYFSQFSLEPLAGYALTAYAQKGETNRNIVLYNPEGIYVNDYNGNDSNTGTSPDEPLKTLEKAATLTTSTKNTIYVCDSTLTVSTTQNIALSSQNVIMPFLFRTSAYMIRITTDGDLTLKNVSLTTGNNYYLSGLVRIDAGNLLLDAAKLYAYNRPKVSTYGIYSTGGTVIMNNGSGILCDKSNSTTTNNGYGIYLSGASSTITLDAGTVVENQYTGVYVARGTLDINGATIQGCGRSTGRALTLTGNGTICNMTAGQIINNGYPSYSRAVLIENQAVFNFSGGRIADNNTPAVTNPSILGEQIAIQGGTMDFTGGTVKVSAKDRNVIQVQSSSSSNPGRLMLSDAAVLDSGFIYCDNSYRAPIVLTQPLTDKRFHINLSDNMGGCVLVDGTSSGTTPAVVDNFTLNPALAPGLSLKQDGDNVIVYSNSIYLHGSTGNDANDGLTAATAVKTFTRAKDLLLSYPDKNIITILGGASLGNTDESSSWDLSAKSGAIIQRGIGYTNQLVYVPANKSLTLSNITFDGRKENVISSNYGIIYLVDGATLTVQDETIIRNNANSGIYAYGTSASPANVIVEGGEITDNSYGIYSNYSNLSVSGGLFKNNFNDGIYAGYSICSITGGVITENSRYGIIITNTEATVSGSETEITENNHGIYVTNSSKATVSGGMIYNNTYVGIYSYHSASKLEVTDSAKIYENNTGVYIYQSDSVRITGGEIYQNKTHGIHKSAVSELNYFSISGGKVNENTQHGIYFESACKKVVISGGEFARNKDRGIYLVGCEDVSITGGNVLENGTYGIGIYNCPTISIEGGLFSGNKNGAGVLIDHTGVTAAKATITGGTFTQNSGYGGFHFARNVEYEISGNTLITENKTRGIYSNSPTPSSISGDVVIKGNKIMGDGGGISVLQGTVNISGNVTFEADTVTYLSNVGYDGGAIAVKEGASVVISGNVKIKDCVLVTTNTTNHGGSAIHVKGTAAKPGSLVMTGGSITGCKTTDNYGTVYAAEYGNITLNNVHIENNTAKYGGAIFVYKGGKVTLSGDTIRNNNTIAQVYNNDQGMLFTGNIHISGGRDGRLYLRDRCYFGEEDVLYLNSTDDRVYVDEALLSAGIAAFPLLSKNLTQGLEVVSPNGTTVSDASQFLTRFLLANTGAADADIALGLDKGGTDEKHIILVNQFFLDTRVADGLNTGVNPRMAFNSLSQLMSILNSPYTTIWVSGPVEVKADITLPAITTHHVNFRRYTGFAVAKQLYSVYDSVMFVIPQGKTLTIPGGNSATNTLTISGEGEGSDPAEASLFKNNGTLTIDGFVSLYFNPTAGNGSAIYQNGTLNLNGTVDFNTYSTNTIYLPEGRVINLDGFAATTNPAGITVETSPSDTHYPGRVIATGTTAGVPAGTEACFVNELTTAPLPIGRTTEGGRADLIFYLSDRNVAGVPIYITLQDAFAASATAGNDEVRLYGDTEEQIFIDRPVQYRSKGHAVAGSFTLDSTANVTLLDDLTTDTLYLRANMFSKKAQLDRGAHAITLRDAAYFDLMLPENPQQSDWYPVNLPFDVSLSDIRNLADTAAVLLFRKDYAVAAYDGQRRATYGIGNQPSNINNDWQYLATPLMTNGTGYMVSTGNIRTLRFKAANLNSVFSTSTSPMTYYMGTAGAPHQGINYLAQPMGANSTIAGGLSAGIIQVSETLSSDRIGWTSYVAKSVGSSPVIAPYTNYFHQTASTGFVSYAKSSASATVRSSPESSESLTDAPRYYELRLFDDDPQRYDALFVAASDLASADTYEIGRDVLKMGAAGRALRIWSHAFGVDLCANEVVMEGSSASIPVFIHLPEVGKIYTLRLENRTDEREQLWLYYGDRPVRELTKHPEYTMEGTGGTEEYSLRIFSGPTGQLPADLTGAYVYAENGCIVIAGLASGDGYIVSDISGRLFADGRSVGAPVRIPVANGAYVVRINGKSAKIIVSK